MSINQTLEESATPPRHVSKLKTEQAEQKTSSRVPRASEASSQAKSSSRSPGRPESSYTVFKRDVLYRAINEFQLSGPRLSAYTELLTRLGFDLTPLVQQDQTWYLCRGKQENGSPCRRMVPEVYLRTTVGRILRAADKPELRGDDLVDTLATAFSYAICSEHHRKIHKVARAIDARKIVEQWREGHGATPGITTPARAGSPSTRVSAFDPAPRTPSPKAPRDEHVDNEREDVEVGGDGNEEAAQADGTAERLEVERHYQEYLRKSSHERRSGSDAGSSVSSNSASRAERSSEKRWRILDQQGSPPQ